MSTIPQCPTCHAPIPAASSEASSPVLVCGVCGERFEASVNSNSEPVETVPVVRPTAPPTTATSVTEPVAEPSAELIEEPVAEVIAEPLDAESVSSPIARPVARARRLPEAETEMLPKAEVVPKAKAPNWPQSTPKQPESLVEDSSRGTGIVLLLGAGCFLAVCGFLAAVGFVTWLVVERINEKVATNARRQEEAKEPPANKPEEILPTPQTKLREVRALQLPKVPDPKDRLWSAYTNPYYTQIAYSPKHKLLFVRNADGIWIYDLKADEVVETRAPKEQFADMSLSSDESFLFASDYGGEDRSHKPLRPSHIHRYDLAARKWERREAPGIAQRLETVDSGRFFLVDNGDEMRATLNHWHGDGRVHSGLVPVRLGNVGDMVYDPRTECAYFGSEAELVVVALNGGLLKVSKEKPDTKADSLSIALSQDGRRLYRGKLQFDTAKREQALKTFPEDIRAASRDVAFGEVGYYEAATGKKLGEFGFNTTQPYPDEVHTVPPAIAVSPDGRSVWVIDRDMNVIRQFAIEGEKK